MPLWQIFLVTIALARSADAANSDGGGFGAFSKSMGPSGWFAGARTIALDDASRLYLSPSASARDERKHIALSYSRPFTELDDLSIGSIDLAGTYRSIRIGASYNGFQVGGIREVTGGALTGRTFTSRFDLYRITAARSFGDRWSAGAQANYFGAVINGRSTGRFGLDLGAQYDIAPGAVRATLRNIGAGGNNADALPWVFEGQADWKFFNRLTLGATIAAEEDQDADFRGAAAFEIVSGFNALGGYMTKSNQWSAGVSLSVKDIALQYGILFHPDLKQTHRVTVGYSF